MGIGAWLEIECCYSTVTRIPLLARQMSSRLAERGHKSKLEERYSYFTIVQLGKCTVTHYTHSLTH